jgi:hypothetical protein
MKPCRIFCAARLSLPLASALVALFAGSSVKAQSTLYWDGATPSGIPGGGAGTWDASLTNWDNTLTADSSTAWLNANLDTAVFGGTAGTVTLGNWYTTLLNAHGNPIKHYGDLDIEMSRLKYDQMGAISRFIA